MRILHLCDKLTGGGDAVSMLRLHKGLKRAGCESRILVARNEAGVGNDEIGLFPPRNFLQKASYLMGMLGGINYAAIPGTTKALIGHPLWNWADLVHINTLHGGYFNYRALYALSNLKPIVWTLHDMWAFTGHCSHSFGCTRWETGCGKCPNPEIYPAIRCDFTAQEWKWKQRAFKTVRQFICPSRWLADMVRRSFLKLLPINHLFLGLDLEKYRPRDRDKCRKEWKIPLDRHLLLYASQSLNNPFKDAAMIPRIMAVLDKDVQSNSVLAVMGGGDAVQTFQGCGVPVMNVGYVFDEELKIKLYSAADLLIYTTKADNFPLIVQESISCGCPVASVAVGGIPEVVKHNQTGILVQPGDAEGMSNNIGRVIGDKSTKESLSAAARAFAENNFDMPKYVNGVVDIYRAALS